MYDDVHYILIVLRGPAMCESKEALYLELEQAAKTPDVAGRLSTEFGGCLSALQGHLRRGHAGKHCPDEA